MTTPISLTGRLLCAAQQSYQIIGSGVAPDSPATPAPPPSSLVGWTGRPACQVSGDDGISAVLVGETATEIIVAYRGTEPFDSLDRERMILDWIDDLLIPLVKAPGIPGSVHYGFSHATDELWAWTLQTVQNLGAKPLYVVGHSKGGAMANIAAVKFVNAGLTPFVCTFEAARCGDPAFATGYNAAVLHATRWEFQDDIVPWLPPTDALLPLVGKLPGLEWLLGALIPSYVPVGDLRFINWSNQIVPYSVLLEAQRVTSLVALVSTGHFDTLFEDHSIAPDSGAAKVICPGIWT
jgi:hypothetical protein